MLHVNNTETGLQISEIADGVASAGGYRGTKYYVEGKGVIYDISAYAPYGAPGVAIDNVVDGKLVYGSTGYLDPNVELDYPESIEKGTWYCT